MIYIGDCLEVLKDIADNSIDSIVTDPPYGISFMAKRWDYDVPSVEVWRECMRVLKPGGHMLVACGTCTQHRMVVNIEDAGFEIRDVVTWLYGQGFPKSLNIGKATESEDWDGWGTALKPSAEFWTLARKPLSEPTVAKNVLKWGTGGINVDGCRVEAGEDHAKNCNRANVKSHWSNSKGSNAVEASPQGRFPANLILDEHAAAMLDEQSGILKSGTLAMHHKVKGSGGDSGFLGASMKRDSFYKDYGGDSGGASRFFATFDSLILCHAKASFREWKTSFASIVDESSSLPKSSVDSALAHAVARALPGAEFCSATTSHSMPVKARECETLYVSVTILMLSFDSVALPELLQGKHIPTGCRVSVAEMNAQIGIMTITASHWKSDGFADDAISITIKLNMAAGEKASASRFMYVAKASKSDRGQGNNHPCVKPTSLMAYLCRLITPPGGTVLDPFAGSGSTGVAAIREGFAFLGIEKEAEYAEIAKARINAAS